LLAAAFDACSPATPSARDADGNGSTTAPTVLLVTWDTVRADRVGAYGATSGATPRLDALAAAGLLCEAARAPAPITLVSHATLLTGLPPRRHGVHDNGAFRLGREHVLLSEVLAAQGWRAGAFVGAFVLDAQYGLDQGFEVYGMPAFRRLGLPLQSAERPASEVVDEALAWLDGTRPEEPVFLWTHFYDPHFAYRPPEPQASRFADPYDGEIAFCDSQLGRLLDGLDARGRDGRRLTVVTSDHGEAFGEHGEQTHGIFVYDATQHVPLVLHGTDVPVGRRAGPVSLADVVPTVLDWAGLPRATMAHADGASLLSAAGAEDDDHALVLESWLPWHAHGWMPQRGLVWRGYKYLAARRPELYALHDDPHETRDLSTTLPRIAAACAERLAQLEVAQAPLGPDSTYTVMGDDLERLRSLGYLSGGAAQPSPEDAPDPRERLTQLARRDEALRLLWRGRVRMGFRGLLALPEDEPPAAAFQAEGRRMIEQAAGQLRAARTEDPGDPGLAELMGLAEVTLGHWEAAAACFEVHLLRQPTSATSRFNLAVCYERLGRADAARAQMLHSLRLEPRAPQATRWMAESEAARDEWGAAAWWYERLRAAVGGVLDGELRPIETLRLQALERASSAGQAVRAPGDMDVTTVQLPGRLSGQDGPPPR
jgi:arylsulfatase A-like enzyme